MVTRMVTHALRDRRGVITYLFGPDASWSPRAAQDVIADIESERHDYVVQWPERNTNVHVVHDPHGPYLRTDRDPTPSNNLDELPVAPRADLQQDTADEIDRSQILEPDNTSANIDEAQEARVKDPLWFLARQWQTGEFEAENGGRAAQVHVVWTSFPVDRLARGDVEEPLDLQTPLDVRVEAEVDDGTSPAWDTERLEYVFGVGGTGWELRADEYRGRGLDWYHFDAVTIPATSASGDQQSRRVVPAALSFSGMPHPRWWRLEESTAYLEDAIDPEPNILSMLIPEFLYIDANNWFTIPLEDAVGHIRRVDSVTMVDSFGVSTTLDPVAASDSWRLFCLSADDGVVAASLLFLPNVRAGVLEGEVIEEVALVRDEDANIVWAVEKYYFDDDAGVRRNRGDEASVGGSPPQDGAEEGDPSAYRLKSSVAAHWIPYIPRLVEGQGVGAAQVYLRRARSLETANSTKPQYRGTVLAESWRIHEEEVPRTGLRVQRLRRLAQSGDGAIHVWTGRRTDPAPREPISGLMFDYLDPPDRR